VVDDASTSGQQVFCDSAEGGTRAARTGEGDNPFCNPSQEVKPFFPVTAVPGL